MLDSDVDRWPALAGWRGLLDPVVGTHFNRTFFCFGTPGVDAGLWGPQDALIRNLGIGYRIEWMGSSEDSEATLKARLDSGLPTFFFLWSPHQFLSRYAPSRIQLPTYSAERYAQSLSDFPTELLEKAAFKGLPVVAPSVYDLYCRFRLDNTAQESLLDFVAMGGLSVMQAACGWLSDPRNSAKWKSWIPLEQCDRGEYLDAGNESCALCPTGSSSMGGRITGCTACSAGDRPCVCVGACVRAHERRCVRARARARVCMCMHVPPPGASSFFLWLTVPMLLCRVFPTCVRTVGLPWMR